MIISQRVPWNLGTSRRNRGMGDVVQRPMFVSGSSASYLEGLPTGAAISGVYQGAGWFASTSIINLVQVWVDDGSPITATYGISRDDVCALKWANCPNVGFRFSVDTTKFPNGPHVLHATATTNLGAILQGDSVTVTVANVVVPVPVSVPIVDASTSGSFLTDSMFGGIPNWGLLAGAAVVFWLFSGKR